MKYFILTLLFVCNLQADVQVGAEVLFTGNYPQLLKGKRIGLITNHTAVNQNMDRTFTILKDNAQKFNYKLTALFAPEHGFTGALHADDKVEDAFDPDGIPVFSLHGRTKRPTKRMLDTIDTLIFDIQDIGSRSYTYISTLFYAMEEAAKHGVEVVVLDRPNPINGFTVDGPMLDEKWRSFVGYIDVPYCHGMTVGELAHFFNVEYKVGCTLYIIPMKGWNREMSFHDTGLTWIPTSPHIPEATSSWFYPTTGILGELQIVNIGVGYTLPFKLVGAPWIDADLFAKRLNGQNFPGVKFQPFHYRPFYGKFTKEDCHGVLIVITNPQKFLPVSTQYLLIGILKSLYPKEFQVAIDAAKKRRDMFCKVNGTEEVYNLITKSKFIVWKLKNLHERRRQEFLRKRKKYLIPEYRS